MGQRQEKYVPMCGDIPLDEVASALQKTIRRGLHEEAYYWGYLMLQYGFSGYLWRRLLVTAYEDIGISAPDVQQYVLNAYYSNKIIHKGKDNQTDTNILASVILKMCYANKTRYQADFDYCMQTVIKDGDYQLDVPDYAVDVHTKRGRDEKVRWASTEAEKMFCTEGRTLDAETYNGNPYQKTIAWTFNLNLADDGTGRMKEKGE